VIGVNFHARFLTGGLTAALSDVVRHVRHFVRIAGVEHVAIGSDFEGGIRTPKELADVRGFPVLARALQDSGLSRADVARIFHGNALRVLCGSRPAEKP
jgi:membrane dipeptidase